VERSASFFVVCPFIFVLVCLIGRKAARSRLDGESESTHAARQLTRNVSLSTLVGATGRLQSLSTPPVAPEESVGCPERIISVLLQVPNCRNHPTGVVSARFLPPHLPLWWWVVVSDEVPTIVCAGCGCTHWTACYAVSLFVAAKKLMRCSTYEKRLLKCEYLSRWDVLPIVLRRVFTRLLV